MKASPSENTSPDGKRIIFRPTTVKSSLSREAAMREGEIIRFAVAELGNANAQSFLNGINDGLDGRPLDIATSSTDGSDAVRQAIIVEASKMRVPD